MTSTTQSAWQASHPPATSRFGPILQFYSRLAEAYRIYRERQALLALSDHTLKDIGLSRGDAHREANRRFWDIPENR